MRFWFVCLSLVMLVGCTTGRDLDQPPVPLGDFKLAHSIVVAPNLTKGPLSRDATPEEWIAAFDKAFEDRFRRYDGDKFYHFGISVEGYVLARVGVPLVLQPKSVVIYRITVWDDAAGVKLNSEPKEITVLEAVTAETVAGSGLTQTREEQIENLSILAAKQAEQWLVDQKNEFGWFGGDAADVVVPDEPLDTAETAALTESVETEAAEADTATSETVEAVGDQLVVEPEVAVSDPDVAPFPEEE